ncbi:MAG: hypothetical protein LBR34_11155 [Prevotella sp.]|jgi:hypothetical protein|nr:hypothetical protein [Prevotella sp.]
MKYSQFFIAALFVGIQGLSAQTPEELKSWMPEITGWTVSEKIEIFNPDNLFDRINGAAPLFIENNFREMTALEYVKGDEYITIQAYRHASPEDAFGMYASERSSELKHLPIGGEAQGDNESLYFFAGCIYVKMSGSGSGDMSSTLQQIGGELAQKITPDAGYPAMLRLFPQEKKMPYSESYITSSYIGHEFLRGVYASVYTDENDKPFQLFAIDAQTPDAAREILNKYFAFTKQPLDFQEGELTVKDRYNGNIPIIWKGQYITGVYSESGAVSSGAAAQLKKLADNIAEDVF